MNVRSIGSAEIEPNQRKRKEIASLSEFHEYETRRVVVNTVWRLNDILYDETTARYIVIFFILITVEPIRADETSSEKKKKHENTRLTGCV